MGQLAPIVAPVFDKYTDEIPDLSTALSEATEAEFKAIRKSSSVEMYSNALRKQINGEAKKAAVALTSRISSATVSAMTRVEEMVNSTDEQIATRNSHFLIEQVIGKARTTNTNINYNKNNIDNLSEDLGLDF